MRKLSFTSNLSFLGLVLLTVLGLSCKKDNELAPGFDLFYQQDFSIPAGIGNFDVHHFRLKNIPTNWEKLLEQHGKTAEDITGVITSEASLVGIFGDADFSIVDRIFFRVFDNANPNDFLEIAYRDPTPLEPNNVLPLIPSLADSKRFFTDPRFSVDVVIYLRGITPDQYDVRLSLTMRATF